jgi:hypothetical protein
LAETCQLWSCCALRVDYEGSRASLFKNGKFKVTLPKRHLLK